MPETSALLRIVASTGARAAGRSDCLRRSSDRRTTERLAVVASCDRAAESRCEKTRHRGRRATRRGRQAGEDGESLKCCVSREAEPSIAESLECDFVMFVVGDG